MYFQRLRDLREDKDLRQEDVAEILGISQTVYSRYERGFQTIPVMHLLKLADLQNELLDETSLESFLSGFKLGLGIAAELAPSYSFDDDEEQRACEALQRRRGE